MNTLVKYITGKVQCYDAGLLLLRLLPSYYMLTNHGWNKIINPEIIIRIVPYVIA